MAHEISFEDGAAAMFYVGGVPWHSLGTRLTTPPTTAAEAMAAAHLNWEVARVPLYVSGVGRLIQMPRHAAIIRKDYLDRDDCPIFGIVGSDYQLLQNRDAFKFFDPLIERDTAEYHTAGALGRGERVWVLAKLKMQLQVGPDALEPYVLLANTHDGTGSVTVKLTPVRVVCQNTLTAALRRSHRSWSVRHTKSLPQRLDDARGAIEDVINSFKELATLFECFRKVSLDGATAKAYIDEVIPVPSADVERSKVEAVFRHRRAVMSLFEHGRGNTVPGVEGTLWAAYNGVTEYIDHRKPNRRAADYSESRLAYTWFGQGATVKHRALVAAAKRLPSRPDLKHLAL